ncbi:hypothetical protein HY030_03170 [Candidatus Gottesmanbacteria bacterium]|nr:hypothetical protein [Candidatus Gottesmanbacteria bacterium]
MRIGIDIDDVMVRSGQVFYQRINERFGLNIEFTKVPSFSYVDEQILKKGYSLEDFYKFLTDMQTKSPYHKELVLRRGGREAIKRLYKNGHIIYLISNRHILILPYTTVWLKNIGILRYLSGVLHNTYTQKPYDLFKIREAKRLKVEVFLEDALDYALPLARNKIDVLTNEFLIL